MKAKKYKRGDIVYIPKIYSWLDKDEPALVLKIEIDNEYTNDKRYNLIYGLLSKSRGWFIDSELISLSEMIEKY